MITQYIIHAFTDEAFHGNPAAVCVLDEWRSEEFMMQLAEENKLSETAFLVKEGDHYHLRWFTPGGEIDLCGHATLASGFVILTQIEPEKNEVVFETLSGALIVRKKGDRFEMDLPAYELKPVPITSEMAVATGAFPAKAFMGRDLVLVYQDEETIRTMTPDANEIMKLDGLLVHVTAKGKEFDCVTRSFGPKLKIEEDPVCGSGHCHVIPYWDKVYQKGELTAYQASGRGGTLYCELMGERMKIAGKAVIFSVASLNL